MYEEHFGFSRKPFGINPDPDFLYLNANYREAIALLQYGIQESKGIVSLIGEVGTGKTMLLNLLLASLGPEVQTVAIPPVRFGYDELISFLIPKIGGPEQGRDGKSEFEALFLALHQKAAGEQAVLLIVDEAQDFDNETLEAIRLLSNFETPTRKLLQIILVGQPELRAKLDQTALRQLKQRIAVTYILRPLSEDEIPSYIAHRLKQVGYSEGAALFAPDALALIANCSQGIPRLVNALCDNALLTGYAANKRWVDAGMIREAARDLMLDRQLAHGEAQPEHHSAIHTAAGPYPRPPLPRARVRRAPWRLAVVIAMLLLLMGGLVGEKLLSSAITDWRQQLSTLVEAVSDQPDAPVTQPVRVDVDHTGTAPALAVEQSLAAAEPLTAPALTTAPSHRTSAAAAGAAPGAAVDDSTEAFWPAAVGITADLRGGSGMKSDAVKPHTAGVVFPAAAPSLRQEPNVREEWPPGPQPALEPDSDHEAPEDIPPQLLGAVMSDPGNAREKALGQAGRQAPEFAAGVGAPFSIAVSDDVHAAGLSGEGGVTSLGETPITSGAPVGRSPFQAADAPLGSQPAMVATIGPGDTITRIARSVYDDVGLYELAAIRIANPEIQNLDVVDLGRQVVIPELRFGLLLSAEADGGMSVLLGATQSLATAESLSAAFESTGVTTDIVADKLSASIAAYRVEGRFGPGRPPTEETLDQLSALRLKLADDGE